MIDVVPVHRDGITVRVATLPFTSKPIYRSVAHYAFPTADGGHVDFVGFSVGRTRLARKRAAYEVYERLFAYRPFRQAFLGRVRFPSFTLAGDRPTRSIPGKHVFVLEREDHGAGSGSGAHTSLRPAIAHGVRELVERDLLCRWWYERAFRIQAVGSRKQVARGVFMSSWTVAGGGIPFCVSVIFDDAESVFVTGSKVSETLNQARIGAEREAFALYDTLPAPDARIGWRVKSLRSPLAKDRIAHFRGSVAEGRVSSTSARCSVAKLASACGRSLRGAKYAVLADLPEIKVVQVYCPGFLSKAAARRKHQRSDVPADPFC